MAAPKQTIKVGKVRLSVWEGNYEGKPILSFTIDKPYKDKEGNYVNGKSFSRADLGNVVLACIQATNVLYSQTNTETNSEPEIPF